MSVRLEELKEVFRIVSDASVQSMFFLRCLRRFLEIHGSVCLREAVFCGVFIHGCEYGVLKVIPIEINGLVWG